MNQPYTFSTEHEVDEWIKLYMVGKPSNASTLEEMKEGLKHFHGDSKLREYFLREARKACGQHPDHG